MSRTVMNGPKGIPVRYDEKGEAVYVCAFEI
jgi:hypothetical protein